MTNKQRAEEIVDAFIGEKDLPTTTIYPQGWRNLIDDLEQALDEAYARGQQSILAKMPSFYDCEKWMKHDFYPTNQRDPRLQEFHNYLRTKLTEGEG